MSRDPRKEQTKATHRSLEQDHHPQHRKSKGQTPKIASFTRWLWPHDEYMHREAISILPPRLIICCIVHKLPFLLPYLIPSWRKSTAPGVRKPRHGPDLVSSYTHRGQCSSGHSLRHFVGTYKTLQEPLFISCRIAMLYIQKISGL